MCTDHFPGGEITLVEAISEEFNRMGVDRGVFELTSIQTAYQ